MLLTKLILNPHHSGAIYDLGNVCGLHGRIMSAFQIESSSQANNFRQQGNILFCTDPKEFAVMVQSSLAPDWQRLPKGYAATWQTKDLSFLTNALAEGQTLRFRLKANPSRRNRQSRALYGIKRLEDQIAWLERKARQNGFTLLSQHVLPLPQIVGFKEREDDQWAKVSLDAVLFNGTLRVTDLNAFQAAITQGIGRGKAYGLGMLAIAPTET